MNKYLLGLIFASAISSIVSVASATPITLPQPLSVTSTTDSGVTFNYSGTVSTADTLSFTATGQPCLQSPSDYCTNAAGVVVVAGSSPVGGSSINPDNHTAFGSLLLTIGGQTEQIFQATASNGEGSASPPTALTLTSVSLSSLGFSFATLSNPTFQFIVSDQSVFRSDNIGGFTLTQSGSSQPIPEPVTLSLFGAGLVGAAAMRRRKKARQA